MAKRSDTETAAGPDHDPKRDPAPPGNTEKDPSDWVSGGEPMTGAQASYLKTLSEQAHDPAAFAPDLTKAEASQRIDALKEKLSLDKSRG
ncbi:DUF3072 domain-containing protein [Rhodoplanes sp. TEM]|uniref:DUF3072 domain-containing protein n=1 Tax=Rhodoplanes tepidamans TaxID=200616 RepID=A0ABT5JAP6_RHOTP|nr:MULTISPECIES: DUF3072 domain-containing protein [Rhodoplanes]MDC7786349.1 DUF3072 domain-containing protein [Rhodoplanes tepidamans]MDC7984692.1 DUF3072 domain-containing protein [Rhodoplanes sp. TEM]MDQ0354093.1 hypothetical protein [Rhodoplanes tepidamans]